MNLVFIENAPGSGQIIIVSEAFEHCVVSRRLEPGDSARIVMSRFKSIVIDEEVVAAKGLADPAGHWDRSSADSDDLRPPAGSPRRREGGRSLAYRLRRSAEGEVPAGDRERELINSRKIALPK
jgi:hypothetical protein